mmetsp:Transcript_35537/g.92913  ORF Transcript_35537/g.92913 Transcript_35537/m.92913 type:complete len:218 (-) Transcript_35537:1468-2121(-)
MRRLGGNVGTNTNRGSRNQIRLRRHLFNFRTRGPRAAVRSRPRIHVGTRNRVGHRCARSGCTRCAGSQIPVLCGVVAQGWSDWLQQLGKRPKNLGHEIISTIHPQLLQPTTDPFISRLLHPDLRCQYSCCGFPRLCLRHAEVTDRSNWTWSRTQQQLRRRNLLPAHAAPAFPAGSAGGAGNPTRATLGLTGLVEEVVHGVAVPLVSESTRVAQMVRT